MNPYADIIELPHHVSEKRAHMPVYDRAAQFSPFAALTGYEGAIKETARLTEERIELDETQKAVLDEKLRIIQEHLMQDRKRRDEADAPQRETQAEYRESLSEVTFTYYVPDEKKDGGAYVSVRGIVKKIDLFTHSILLEDGSNIPIDDIIEIQLETDE